MSEEFKVIETQEQLNAVIGKRIERAEKQYLEEKANLQKEIASLKETNDQLSKTISENAEKSKMYDDTLADLQGKVKKYESDSVKQKIAREMGLPFEMADRLRGENEDELKQDAETLKAFLPKAPQKSTSQVNSNSDSSESALRKMLADMSIN